MLTKLKGAARMGLLACVATAIAWPATAQNVVLRLGQGGVTFEGELVGWDGSSYTIRSAVFGEMRLEAERFDCLGDACPTTVAAAARPQQPTTPVAAAQPAPVRPATAPLAIAGPGLIAAELVPDLIAGFARQKDQEVEIIERDAPTPGLIRLKDKSGEDAGRVDFRSLTTEASFEAMINGDVDIVVSPRPITAAEARAFAALGFGEMRSPETEQVLAIDAVQVVVSPSNPLTEISMENLAEVFSGGGADWSRLGAGAGPVRAYAPRDNDLVAESFNRIALAPSKRAISSAVTRTDTQMELIEAISKDPYAIGVVSAGTRHELKTLSIASACGIATPPSLFAIKNEEYPLESRVYVYRAPRARSAISGEFFDYMVSQDAQRLIRSSRLVDQTPVVLSADSQGNRLYYALATAGNAFDLDLVRQLFPATQGSYRLSLTFRFLPGTFQLDNRAVADIERLAEILEQEANAGKVKVLVAGFADSIGGSQQNQRLSTSRADAVRDALSGAIAQRNVNVEVESAGFGEISPVACNTTATGRQLNRRVEIWIQ